MQSLYSITFVNGAWVSAVLDIRTGANQDCNTNVSVGPIRLKLNDSYTLQTDDVVVCYRRLNDPDDQDSGWQAWNSFAPDDQNTPMTIEI